MAGGYAERIRPGPPGGAPTLAAAAVRREEERPIVRRVRFDRMAVGSVVLVDPKPANPLTVNIYTGGAGVDHSEVTGIGIKAAPFGVWHNMVSWTLRIGRGGVQEFVASSGVSGGTPTDRDAGLRYCVFGSLRHPEAVSIKLRGSQVLQVAIVDYAAVTSFPNVSLTIHARVQGYQFYRIGG